MDGYTKLHEMLETALKQAGEESGMLLGQELTIALSDSLSTTKTSYFGGLDDACFVMGVESRESYSGQLFLVFSLRDAIVMSSILLGIPPARIQEKKRLAIMENDDVDAFAEIANMINGSFNTVFQNALPDKVRLKLLSPKKYIPEIDTIDEEEPLPDGDYLMFRSKLEMPDQELNHLDVLIPVALGELFDPQPKAEAVAEEGGGTDAQSEEGGGAVAREGEPDAEGAAAVDEGVDSIVVLEDDDTERRMMVEAVGFSGYQIVEGTLNADLKEMFSGRNVRLVLIGSLDADDRELAVCIKINALRQDAPPPIIMTAQRWTRTAVLKALKYGARDIVIKPCSGDELAAKVSRFCKQPR